MSCQLPTPLGSIPGFLELPFPMHLFLLSPSTNLLPFPQLLCVLLSPLAGGRSFPKTLQHLLQFKSSPWSFYFCVQRPSLASHFPKIKSKPLTQKNCQSTYSTCSLHLLKLLHRQHAATFRLASWLFLSGPGSYFPHPLIVPPSLNPTYPSRASLSSTSPNTPPQSLPLVPGEWQPLPHALGQSQCPQPSAAA